MCLIARHADYKETYKGHAPSCPPFGGALGLSTKQTFRSSTRRPEKGRARRSVPLQQRGKGPKAEAAAIKMTDCAGVSEPATIFLKAFFPKP
jgi:hypothetical protein